MSNYSSQFTLGLAYGLELLLLGPLLAVQGRYTRWKTPTLPEPQGERAGSIGLLGEKELPSKKELVGEKGLLGKKLSILVLGDSAAAGVGVDTQQQALAAPLAALLSEHHQVNWELLAESGLTTAQLLEKVNQHPTGHFDYIVVSIGVNDVTGLVTARKWLAQLNALNTRLQQHYAQPHLLYSQLPPMHLFPALPQPLRHWLGLRAKRFNLLLEGFCQQNGQRFIRIPYSPGRRLIAADGFHPGAGAYQVWAKCLAEAILQDTRHTN